jgi:transposase-like protein
VRQEAVRIYVKELTSYRRLSVQFERRLGRRIAARTLNRWVDDLAERASTPLEVSARLRPTWSGVLGVDGKRVWVGGREHAMLVGVDVGTQDLVHELLLPGETAAGFRRLVHEAVRDADYPLEGLICDAHPGFVEAHRDYFARVPLQLCRIHFDRRLDAYLPSGWSMQEKATPAALLRRELKHRIRAVLYAPTELAARGLWRSLRGDYERYRNVMTKRANPLTALSIHWEHYMAHHRILGMPADNNIVENVIRQLARKLRLMEGFQNPQSADRFLRLLVGCYRFTRFTDSTRPSHNGKAPLEIAGIDISTNDWLDCLTQQTH